VVRCLIDTAPRTIADSFCQSGRWHARANTSQLLTPCEPSGSLASSQQQANQRRGGCPRRAVFAICSGRRVAIVVQAGWGRTGHSSPQTRCRLSRLAGQAHLNNATVSEHQRSGERKRSAGFRVHRELWTRQYRLRVQKYVLYCEIDVLLTARAASTIWRTGGLQ